MHVKRAPLGCGPVTENMADPRAEQDLNLCPEDSNLIMDKKKSHGSQTWKYEGVAKFQCCQ